MRFSGSGGVILRLKNVVIWGYSVDYWNMLLLVMLNVWFWVVLFDVVYVVVFVSRLVFVILSRFEYVLGLLGNCSGILSFLLIDVYIVMIIVRFMGFLSVMLVMIEGCSVD